MEIQLKKGFDSKMIRILQAGLGRYSKIWLDAIAESDEVELAAIVETDPQSVDRAMQLTKIDSELICTDFRRALETVEADVVLNLTPPAVHESIILSALDTGLHVLTEKPLADSMPAAERIVTKSNQTGLLVMVAQNYRYKSSIQTVKNLLSSGELGRLSSIRIDFRKSAVFQGFHMKLSHPLLLDMSIHHFDLLRFFLEVEPTSIFARSWNPPWSWYPGDASTAVELEFQGGVVASYGATWVATGEITDWNGIWHFDCEKGVLILNDDGLFFERRTEDERDLGGFFGFGSHGVEPMPVFKMERDPQVYLLHEFAGALNGRESPKTTCQDNIHSLQIVFDAIESAQTGEVIHRS